MIFKCFSQFVNYLFILLRRTKVSNLLTSNLSFCSRVECV